MEQVIIAVISMIAGIFGFIAYSKHKVTQGQVKLETEVKKLEQKAGDIQAGIDKNEKETQGKVDEITKEQDKNLTGQSLADWFNRKH